jgi:hypothetical protein
MPTIRHQILDNVVTTLKKILVARGYALNVVSVSREVEHWEDVSRFPALFVIADDEQPTLTDVTTLIQSDWTVGILGYVKHAKKLSDELEKIIGDVRKAILVDETRGGLAEWTTIKEIRVISTWLKPIGIFEMDLGIQYRHQEATP